MTFSNDRQTLLKELFRKSIHICSACVPFLLRIAYWPVIIGFMVIVVLYYISEICRLEGHPIPLISLVTETAARKVDEGKIVLGPVTLVFGFLTAALVFPLEYAKVGIFALSFGDGLASLVGKSFGKKQIPFMKGKTYAGSLACFFAVFCSTLLVSKNIIISICVAFAAMIIEVLPLGDFDNLIIPSTISFLYMMLSNWL